VEHKVLYHGPGFVDMTRLERRMPGAAPGTLAWPGGLEIFVLENDPPQRVRQQKGRQTP